MSLEEIIESYESTTTLIDNNEQKEITKIDICLNYAYSVSDMLKKQDFNVEYDKKMILSDKDKDLDVLFEKYKILIRCKFRIKKKVCYHDINMLSSTLNNDKYKEHVGVMVSNQDYSDNAKKEANNAKIIICRTENLVKKIADHITFLKRLDDKLTN
ncbi:18136_t:CDS:2 [Cetraspora pellucida]|uniref:18136_t:CDS:1 n=1 Tax=Cetraspora pellucida TaxID=1433469 RepID=A0ACA9QBX4_9GLOM|nr:18136_t:CDS:2 [Cetraspora pellucida]